jgi:hypothetical protein
MTPELTTIIEQAYEVFGRYRLHDTLTVCHCNVCMTVAAERALIKTPLRKIPSSLLAEYTNSAHDWDDGPVAREMRYLLPRYLELIGAGDPPDIMGLDICLRRLGNAGWREKWPTEEVQLIDRFLDALLIDSLGKLEVVEWPVGWKLAFDLKDVLTCVITAKGNLDRVLAAWDSAEDPPAAIHMAAMRDSVVIEGRRTHLYSAYLEKAFDKEADTIGQFLMRPEVEARLEAAFFKTTDPHLQKILSDAMLR